MDTSRTRYADYHLEKLRETLEKDQQKIKITDLGAGSQVSTAKERSVGQIAKAALSSKWQCKIMFNLVNHYGAQNILELGASLGVATLYLWQANKSASITTIEGDPAVAKIAQKNYNMLGAKNIQLIRGNFDEVIDEMKEEDKFDLIFVDGNHTEDATVAYHRLLYNRLSPKGMMVFDDIYWSEGMTKAWRAIKAKGDHQLSLDLYYFGIIFKDAGMQQKQSFEVIPYGLKPFDLGFFPKKQ